MEMKEICHFFSRSNESLSMAHITHLPWGGVVVPPQEEHRRSCQRGRFAALLGFAQLAGERRRPRGFGPAPRRGSGSGPLGLSGHPAAGFARCEGRPLGPARPRPPGRRLPGISGTPGPRPPLAAGWPRPPSAAWTPRPLGLRLPLRGTARFVPRSLARPIGAGALRLARRALPPGGPASGRGLGPGSAPSGWLRPGPLCAWRLPRPSGPSASRRGWSALALSGLGFARPAPPRVPLGPPRRLRAAGSSPFGARPGSLRPGGGAALRAASDGFAAPGAGGPVAERCRLRAAMLFRRWPSTMIKADALHPLDLLHVVSYTRGGPRRAAGCVCDPAHRASRISSQDLPATEKKEG